MSKNLKLSLIIWFVFSLFMTSYGQREDFQSWNSVSIKKDIGKRFSVSGEQEVRLNNNATQLNNYLTVIGGSYSVNKYIDIRSHYRITFNKDIKDGNSFDYRFYGDVILSYDFERFQFSFRERYEYKHPEITRDELSYYRFQHLRHKLSVNYDVPKSSLEPFAEIELYQSLNNPVKNGMDKYRLTLGIEKKFTDYLACELFYRYQSRSDYVRKSLNAYIVGFGIKISL